MQTYELVVRNRSVKANSDDVTLVRGSVGVDRVHVMFDSAEWLDFPVTATFGNGDRIVTASATMEAVTDSDEFSAETTVDVPWEVVRKVGRIRVTLQGTDASGNHIVTAYGAPLSVEESGDVVMGDIPSEAPTISQYEQVYAEVVAKIAEASDAIAALGDIVRRTDVATYSDPGIVMPDGTTITVDTDGTIHGVAEVAIATTSVPGIVMPDGTTISVDEDGRIAYTLPTATTSRLGGMIVGDGLTAGSGGKVSVRAFSASEIDDLTPLDDVLFDADGTGF